MPPHQHNSVLLPRLLSLKDYSPFILVLDAIDQSCHYLIEEFLSRVPKTANTIALTFGAYNPHKTHHTIYCSTTSLSTITPQVKSKIKDGIPNLIFIDTLAYIPHHTLSDFLFQLIQPGCTVVACYHGNSLKLDPKIPYYPSPLALLEYFATAVLSVRSKLRRTSGTSGEEIDTHLQRLTIPFDCNSEQFDVHMVRRRKSGRGVWADFEVDVAKHSIEYIVLQNEEPLPEDISLLKGLTTFNLATTEDQRKARDQVELPYLQAQEIGQGGAQGGAIIYEFEKDDDYDEEDPYEDPF